MSSFRLKRAGRFVTGRDSDGGVEMVGVSGGALRRVGKYEVGRTIGEGTYAKVKFT
jgi:hypothetical protein